MRLKTVRNLFIPGLFIVLSSQALWAGSGGSGQTIKVSLQKRIQSEQDKAAFIMVNEVQDWNPLETAIIICDMWDEHWCTGATRRVAEMAPIMNDVVSTAREMGILIVHAPSDCMDYYKNHPGRKLGKKYRYRSVAKKLGEGKLDSEKEADWPFEISGGQEFYGKQGEFRKILNYPPFSIRV